MFHKLFLYCCFLVILNNLLLGCVSKDEPIPIRLNEDICDYCGMQISDIRFCAELLTKKGKIFKFDDINCLVSYIKKQHIEDQYKQIFFADYYAPAQFVILDHVKLFQATELHAPMGGHCIALSTLDSVPSLQLQYKGNIISWKSLF